MNNMSYECFAGLGQHTINDLCHLAGISPATPSLEICSNDLVFKDFQHTLEHFMDGWASTDFEQRLCTRSNNENPFAFDRTQDRAYVHYAMKVFRKASMKMESHLFNTMAQKGWFDPGHTIGISHSIPHI